MEKKDDLCTSNQEDKPSEQLEKVLSRGQQIAQNLKIKIKLHLNKDEIDLKIEERNKLRDWSSHAVRDLGSMPSTTRPKFISKYETQLCVLKDIFYH